MWGEPLINQNIFHMIRETASYAAVNISTNALLLNDRTVVELIQSGVTDLIVSIDGVTQETYQKYRVGGDVSKAFKILKMLAKENRANGNQVKLIPQMIVFDHNQHEVESFSAICQELGLMPFFKQPYIRSMESEFRAAKDPQFQRKTYQTRTDLIKAMSSCSHLREVFTITVSGDVILCSCDYDSEVVYGNILDKESSVESIWMSDKSRTIRNDIMNGRPCDVCNEKCLDFVLSTDYPVAKDN